MNGIFQAKISAMLTEPRSRTDTPPPPLPCGLVAPMRLRPLPWDVGTLTGKRSGASLGLICYRRDGHGHRFHVIVVSSRRCRADPHEHFSGVHTTCTRLAPGRLEPFGASAVLAQLLLLGLASSSTTNAKCFLGHRQLPNNDLTNTRLRSRRAQRQS
ncbi:hypothetical protein BD309DRAFT_765685 [Dichomitus squalens]|nr:hypothetical protein BD309DRAFT_765685 [Dichomitus squalens]